MSQETCPRSDRLPMSPEEEPGGRDTQRPRTPVLPFETGGFLMRSRPFPSSAELARETILPKSCARAVLLFTTAAAILCGGRAAQAQESGHYETVVTAPPREGA